MKYDIVVCDSGVSQRHIDIVDNLGKGSYLDENGHGSQIIDTIFTIDDSVKIGAIKILDGNKEGSLEELIDALRRCVNIDTKVILLAIALDTDIECSDLEEVINKLHNQNKVIVSAVFNGKEKSIPAIYPTVIGVKMDYYMGKSYEFDNKREIQCILSIDQIVCEALDGKFRSFSGNSLSATVLAAVYASMLKTGIMSNQLQLEDFFYDKYIRQFFQLNVVNKENKKVLGILDKLGYKKNNLYEEMKGLEQVDQLFLCFKEEGYFLGSKKFFKTEYLSERKYMYSFFEKEENFYEKI